jgi:acyl carrier protein
MMDEGRIDELLREVSATILGVDSDTFSDSSSPDSLGGWTSIRHLSLIAAVEEAFSIQLSVVEIYGSQRFGELRRIVTERLRQSEGA